MFTFTSPIVTNRLVLRPYTAEDVEDLYAILLNPNVVRYLYWEVCDRDQVRDAIERKSKQTQLAEQDDALTLAMVSAEAEDTKTGVIGEIKLWLRSVEHRQGEIGFILNPRYQGRGFASEAATAILDLAFGELALHRVYGRTDVRNTASSALMRRLGMRQEAHLIHNEIFKGEWGDELVFAILEDEWRAQP